MLPCDEEMKMVLRVPRQTNEDSFLLQWGGMNGSLRVAHGR
jgi:hypothetical protein